jgi:hypothetical protein
MLSSSSDRVRDDIHAHRDDEIPMTDPEFLLGQAKYRLPTEISGSEQIHETESPSNDGVGNTVASQEGEVLSTNPSSIAIGSDRARETGFQTTMEEAPPRCGSEAAPESSESSSELPVPGGDARISSQNKTASALGLDSPSRAQDDQSSGEPPDTGEGEGADQIDKGCMGKEDRGSQMQVVERRLSVEDEHVQEETAEQNAEIEGEEAEEEQHEEEQHEEEQHDRDASTKTTPQKTKRMNAPTPKTITARLSKKRSRHGTSTGTPPKRSKLGGSSGPESQTITSGQAGAETTSNPSYWDEWDTKREAQAQQQYHNSPSIKAVRVWRRLSSCSSAPSTGKSQQGVSQGRVDVLVKMVLAVANSHAFGALKEVMFFLQQDGGATTAGIFSTDPKVLVRAVNGIETVNNLNSYLRRFALARLAKLYHNTVANRGHLLRDKTDLRLSMPTVTNKAYKAEAYKSLIQHIWDVAFPARFAGKNKTQGGLIDSDAPDAVRWNRCKRKLSKQVDAGQRWLRLVEKFGWSSLGLINRDWSIGENRVVASDRM